MLISDHSSRSGPTITTSINRTFDNWTGLINLSLMFLYLPRWQRQISIHSWTCTFQLVHFRLRFIGINDKIVWFAAYHADLWSSITILVKKVVRKLSSVFPSSIDHVKWFQNENRLQAPPYTKLRLLWNVYGDKNGKWASLSMYLLITFDERSIARPRRKRNYGEMFMASTICYILHSCTYTPTMADKLLLILLP